MTPKDAIERIKTRFDKWALDNEDLTALQTLGLIDTDSENERIKKEIINYLNFAESHNLLRAVDYKKKKEWLTYLEKQKDKISNIEAICLSAEIHKPYMDGNQWCILKGDNIQEGVVGFGNTQEDALVDFIRNVPIEKQKEQKPTEWSEENVINLTNTIRALQSLGMIQKADHRYDNLIDWLELLHERFNPSHHWKPSEEQMKALEAAFRKEGNDEYRRTINSLYQDLKKLCEKE